MSSSWWGTCSSCHCAAGGNLWLLMHSQLLQVGTGTASQLWSKCRRKNPGDLYHGSNFISASGFFFLALNSLGKRVLKIKIIFKKTERIWHLGLNSQNYSFRSYDFCAWPMSLEIPKWKTWIHRTEAGCQCRGECPGENVKFWLLMKCSKPEGTQKAYVTVAHPSHGSQVCVPVQGALGTRWALNWIPAAPMGVKLSVEPAPGCCLEWLWAAWEHAQLPGWGAEAGQRDTEHRFVDGDLRGNCWAEKNKLTATPSSAAKRTSVLA